MQLKSTTLLRALVLAAFTATASLASVTLFLEEPYGTFGGMNPTGHAAVYLSRICAETPTRLRHCKEGERGVVISRYHRVAGYDWIAMPLLPYLYAVDQPEQVPASVTMEEVALLRDRWRRQSLVDIIPNGDDGAPPAGDWIQLVGSAYDRTIYAFEVPSTDEQDDRLIQTLNTAPNARRFNLIFNNCADFARHTINLYYPDAIHRSIFADVGIMTPRQAAVSLLKYGKRHDLQIPMLVIPQIPGSVPRSSPVRGVLQSLVKSKRYAVPLAPLAALHPFFGGSLALAWIEGQTFDPRKMANPQDATNNPAAIAQELQSISAGVSGD